MILRCVYISQFYGGRWGLPYKTSSVTENVFHNDANIWNKMACAVNGVETKFADL